jgi:hypothetical protein
MNAHSMTEAPTNALAIREAKGGVTQIAVVNSTVGFQIVPQNFGEMLSFAQVMAKGGAMIRPHLRENPGACLGIISLAYRWGMDPFAVANKSYFVNDQTAFEAQLVAAVIINCAPIKDRPEYIYEGEGGERRCTAVVETKAGRIIRHQSPKLKDIKPQNSPLWKSDPDQQQGYYTVRAMARLHFPDVILGVYDREEIEYAESPARFAQPQQSRAELLSEKLAAKQESAPKEGFNAEVIETASREIGGGKEVPPVSETKPAEGQGPAAPATEAKGEGAPAPEDYSARLGAFREACARFTEPDGLNAFISDFGEHDGEEWFADAPTDVADQIQRIADESFAALKARRVEAVDEVMGTEPATEEASAADQDEDAPEWGAMLAELDAELSNAASKTGVNDITKAHDAKGTFASAPKDILETAAKIVDRHIERVEKRVASNAKATRTPKAPAPPTVGAAPEKGAEAIPACDPALLEKAMEKAAKGARALKLFLGGVSQREHDALLPHKAELDAIAKKADEL